MKSNNVNIPVPDPNDDRLKYRFPAASLGDTAGIMPYYADSVFERGSVFDDNFCLSDEIIKQNGM